MIIENLKIIFENLLKLALIAYPLFYLFIWFQSLLLGVDGSKEILYALETGAFYYIGSILYLLLSGIIYNSLLFLIPNSLNQITSRMIAIILTSIIPALLILFGERALTIVGFIIPLVISLFIYGIIVSIPSKERLDKDVK